MDKFFTGIRERLGIIVQSMHNGMSQKKFLCLIAIFVGLLAGIGAALLKDFINALSEFIRNVVPANVNSPVFILLPVVGILLCGIYSRYIVKDDMEGGASVYLPISSSIIIICLSILLTHRLSPVP